MSFIPSFILSALLFCNVSVPGGWDGATLTEGIICEIPYTKFTVSVEEQSVLQDENTGSQTDMLSALKNGAIVFQSDASGLKLAAGSLSVSGTSGTDVLTATLPARTDGGKPLAFFASWKKLALLATTASSWEKLNAAVSAAQTGEPFFNKAIIQFRPAFFSLNPDASLKPEMKVMLFGGWFFISPTKETSWFLLHPWHSSGNLLYLSNDLTLRLTFPHAKAEIAGTASFSLPDISEPAAAGGLSLLLKTKHTETDLSCFVTPPAFLMPAGSYTGETFRAEAGFLFTATPASLKTQTSGKKQTGAALSVSADAALVQKQPATVGQTAKQLLSAELAASYDNKKAFKAGISLSADKICIEDECRDSELSPALEVTLSQTSLSAKATFLPFTDEPDESRKAPAWSLKAERSLSELEASYTAEFSGTILKKQTFSLTHEQGPVSLCTEIAVKNETLTWKLSYARSW